MADQNRNSLLTIATLLLMLSSVGEGLTGLCPETLKNIAVNEGEVNIAIEIGVNGGQLMITPTMDELGMYVIKNLDNTLNPDLSGDYNLDSTGFTILNATTFGNGHPINTAGLYFAKCAGSPETYGFKVLVIQKGPTCSKKPSSSSKNHVDLTCSVTYADSIYHPILPTMTWYRKDKTLSISTETPERTNLDPYVYTAMSTVTVQNDNQEYRCEVTFGETTQRQDPNIATNAPTYNQNCLISL